MSSVSGTFDSTVNLLVPALQAAATLTILSKQKGYHDDIADKRIDLIDQAVTKYIQSITALVNSGKLTDGYGKVPQAAEYVPVDALEEQFATINENLQNTPAAERLMAAANRMNEQNDIARMVVFCPAFLHNAHKISMTVRDLLNGKYPVGDVIEIMTDLAEQKAALGKIGPICNQTARMLGLSRLRAQAAGRAAHAGQASVTQQVSPIQRQMSIQDMLQTPANRISLALSQAQLIQASLQNLYNTDAAGDPAKFAEIQIELQKITSTLGQEAQRGNLINQFVPDFASILAPQVKSISQALLGSGMQTGFDGAGNNSGGGAGVRQGLAYDIPPETISQDTGK